MTHELVYTSAARGVRRGATGYCTVAKTADLPAELAELLEVMSRYRHLVKGPDPARNGNPVSHAHAAVSVGYRTYHVLSRIADTGLEQTGRSNYLAHHLVAGPDDLPAAGPAWVLEQPRLFHTAWEADREPEVLKSGRRWPDGSAGPRRCKKWERATGDAGWAGVLAGATDPARPAYLVFEPGQDVLGLIAEALALLPPADRWRVSFNTYFTGTTADVPCQWRCVVADSAEAADAIAARRGLVIRTDRPMTGAAGGPLAEAARTGIVPERAEAPAPAPRSRTPGPMVSLSDPPPRGRLPDDRPARPLPDDEPDDLPVAAKDRAAGGRPPAPAGHSSGGIGPLLVGILLGLLLGVVAVVLVEIGTGRSLPRHAKLVGMDTEDKKELDSATQTAADRDAKLKEVGARAEQLPGAQALADRYATDAEKWKKRFEDQETEFANTRRQWEKAEGDLRKKLDEAKKAPPPREGNTNPAKEPVPDPVPVPPKPKAEKNKKAQPVQPVPFQDQRSRTAPAAPVVVPPRPLKPEELAKPDAPILLFDSKLKDARIELPGLDPRFRADPREGGPKVTVRDIDGQPVATLEVDKNGVVTLGGRGLAANPTLGLAVVKVTAGSESHHRQLFKETEIQSAPLKADGDKGVFTLDPFRLLREQHPKSQVWEDYGLLAAQDGALALDRKDPLKVRVGGKDVTLDPESDRPTRARGETTDFTVAATLEKGKLVIDVVRKAGGAAPPELTVQSLKIIRPVKDGDTVLLQEFVRIKPPGGAIFK